MTGIAEASAMALAGLGVAVLVGRRAPRRWQPVLVGGATGVFGVAAIWLGGWSMLPMPALIAGMAVYGAALGAIAQFFGRNA